MSNTKKHKDQGKFHNNILKSDEVCESTKNMWDRHNNDFGEFRKRKKDKQNKIAEKELKEQLKIDEYNFDKEGKCIDDEEL